MPVPFTPVADYNAIKSKLITGQISKLFTS